LLFPWIKRSDLLAVPHDSGGWVIKDPLTLQYSFLDDIEYAVLNLMDGQHDFASMLTQASRLCPKQPLTPDDLGQFIQALAGHQLIRQTMAGDSTRLRPTTMPTWKRLVQPMFRVLRLHIPLFNPTRLLTATLPVVKNAFSPRVLLGLVIVGITALLIVGLRFQELTASLPTLQEFLGPQNMLLMLAIFVVVKLLHEAGHAYTARHFGAHCHDCGIMLMVLTPVLYTNVSDAWMLPKRQRMVVTAAGILVELSIAAVCTLLWAMAQPGSTRSLLLNTMVLCSVNTILFNGNPLLRFDGYFLLADALGIPNLAARASAVLQSVLLKIVAGRKLPTYENRRTWINQLVYGILAAVYRTVLTLAILRLVDHLTSEWNVRFMGRLLTISILTGFLVLPAVRFVKAMFAVDQSRPSAIVRPWRAVAVVGILGALLLIPLPQSVVVPAFVQPTAVPVYAALPGRLISAKGYGQPVAAGEAVVTLRNPELDVKRQQLSASVQERQLQLDSLTRNPATANSELIPALRESLKAAQQQRDAFSFEFAGLTLTSSVDGLFFPPPAVSRIDDPDLPEFWHGTATDNIGAWMNRGTLLGYLGQPTDVLVLACVPEDDVEFLKPDQAAEFLAMSGGAQVVTGTVAEVSTVEARTLPAALGVSGLTSGRLTESGVEPLQPTWFAAVRLKFAADSMVPLYAVGRVRIVTEPASILQRLQRYLRQTF